MQKLEEKAMLFLIEVLPYKTLKRLKLSTFVFLMKSSSNHQMCYIETSQL